MSTASTTKKRLPPASLATDGEQAQGAAAYRSREQEHNLVLAYWEHRAARLVAQASHALDAYSNLTDEPPAGIVHAADWLTLAAEALADGRGRRAP